MENGSRSNMMINAFKRCFFFYKPSMSLVDGHQWFIQTGGQATKTHAHAKQELQGLKSEGNTNQNLPKRMTFLNSLV